MLGSQTIAIGVVLQPLLALLAAELMRRNQKKLCFLILLFSWFGGVLMLNSTLCNNADHTFLCFFGHKIKVTTEPLGICFSTL